VRPQGRFGVQGRQPVKYQTDPRAGAGFWRNHALDARNCPAPAGKLQLLDARAGADGDTSGKPWREERREPGELQRDRRLQGTMDDSRNEAKGAL
jgi:hypothetical protein